MEEESRAKDEQDPLHLKQGKRGPGERGLRTFFGRSSRSHQKETYRNHQGGQGHTHFYEPGYACVLPAGYIYLQQFLQDCRQDREPVELWKHGSFIFLR